MYDHKIIVTGPVGAGKSTAIRTYSTSAVVDTDVGATDETQLLKAQTTVAMDYGTIQLDAETKIHLYGTPGQERFEFMWDILRQGSRGLIILVNAGAEDVAADLCFYLQAFASVLSTAPVVVGISHTDIHPDVPALKQQLQAVLDAYHCDAPILETDPRQRKSVNRLIKAILFSDRLFAA